MDFKSSLLVTSTILSKDGQRQSFSIYSFLFSLVVKVWFTTSRLFLRLAASLPHVDTEVFSTGKQEPEVDLQPTPVAQEISNDGRWPKATSWCQCNERFRRSVFPGEIRQDLKPFERSWRGFVLLPSHF